MKQQEPQLGELNSVRMNLKSHCCLHSSTGTLRVKNIKTMVSTMYLDLAWFCIGSIEGLAQMNLLMSPMNAIAHLNAKCAFLVIVYATQDAFP